jgi:cell division protein FtsI (penicillin-binding protein 3)
MDTSGKKLFYYLLITLTAVFVIVIMIRYVSIMLPQDTVVYSDPLLSSRVQRGTIYDRNGTILAYETPYYACAMLLRDVQSLDDTVTHLSKLIDMSPDQIRGAIGDKTTYAMIKKRLSDAEYTMLKYAVQQGKLEGVTIEKRYGRIYPQQAHGAHIIGFTDIDNIGLSGIEYIYDRLLSPLPDTEHEITLGHDIYLTLDDRIQFAADNRNARLVEEHSPESSMIIVMDARSGEILAYSSYPWFDLNTYSTSSATQRMNRPVTMMYEPGSVFKIFSLASILAIGDAQTDKLFYCDGSYTFTMDNGGSSTINCLSAHGEVGPEEILTYSCNGAISFYALQTESAQFHQYLLDFGFSRKTHIDLPGEVSGLLQPPSNWSGRSKPTISFGQEIGVTAIQLVTAATVFTNGGTLLKPQIIKAIHDQETGQMTYTERQEVRKVISEELAEEMLDMMVTATEPGGTAIHAGREGVTVSAKTGTAQILDIETKSYSEDHVLASTLAIFPAEDPQYIIYVAADDPQGEPSYGSAVAAPSVQLLIDDLLSMGLLESASSDVRYLTLD